MTVYRLKLAATLKQKPRRLERKKNILVQNLGWASEKEPKKLVISDQRR